MAPLVLLQELLVVRHAAFLGYQDEWPKNTHPRQELRRKISDMRENTNEC